MNAYKLHPFVAGCLRAGIALWLALPAAMLVGAPAQADTIGIFDPTMLRTTDGREIYEQICQGCHMPSGRGAVGAGHYPALAKDRALASWQYVALTVLSGRRNMPAFGAKHAIGFALPPLTLSDEQIAAVINFVRTHFGNRYTDLISAAQVKALDQGAR